MRATSRSCNLFASITSSFTSDELPITRIPNNSEMNKGTFSVKAIMNNAATLTKPVMNNASRETLKLQKVHCCATFMRLSFLDNC
jgi:hypothetical protein